MERPTKTQYEKMQKEIDEGDRGTRRPRSGTGTRRRSATKYTKDLLAAFPEKTGHVQQQKRVAKVTAEFKTSMERYDTGRRVLRNLIDTTHRTEAQTHCSSRPAAAWAPWRWQPPKGATPPMLELAAAAETGLLRTPPGFRHPHRAVRHAGGSGREPAEGR